MIPVAIYPSSKYRLFQHPGLYPRTFSICNSVVFPALSRPRNRSFACLFRSPSDARVSQTVGRSMSASYPRDVPTACGHFPDGLLTPVDNPHREELFERNRVGYSGVEACVGFGWEIILGRTCQVRDMDSS